MNIKKSILTIKTEKPFQFLDITEPIQNFLQQIQAQEGQILVFSLHTTLSITINEKESGFFEDFENFFKKILPPNAYYKHNDLNIRTENLNCGEGVSECLNGHSHCQHLILGTSEIIPVEEGKLFLGTWQRILAVELDGPRNRKILLQFIGSCKEND